MTARGTVITANVLTDGATVYLAGSGWTTRLSQARLIVDEAEARALLARAQQDVGRRLIVDPYLMEAEPGEDGPRPVSQRERIRARGPTIRYAAS